MSVAATAQYTEEQVGGTTLSGALTLTDPDDLDLLSATVSITGGSFAGDTDVLEVSGASGGRGPTAAKVVQSTAMANSR